MSKNVYIQSKRDHIVSLSASTPLAALQELVWNALDADASEVKVDLVTNPLGGIDAIRVSDNGTGIDILKVDDTFGGIGGSWKRDASRTPGTNRQLHGRRGKGRFKAFALGAAAEWRTTTRVGGELMSYVLRGEIESPGVFELDAADAPGPDTGTEVFVTGVRAGGDSLLDAAETVQSLASRFALYLKSYPDVRIYFNGLPVTPVIVQKSTADYRLTLGNGAEAKLEIIEWKRKFAGSGRLVFAGPDGFELHDQPAGVRSGGASFTAYLVSPRFPALNAENALVMDELNPEVRMYVDAAKKAMKAHFAATGAAVAAGRTAGWVEEGSYPFGDGDDAAERARFDRLAAELAERMESLSEMTPAERGIVFHLLKRAMATSKRGGLKEFLK